MAPSFVSIRNCPTQAKTGLEWATRLKAAVVIHFAYYNFCRVHSTLRVTPVMEVVDC